MRESVIVGHILAYLLNQGAYCFKTHGNPFQSGQPDILGCWRGRTLALEVKVPGRLATPLQLAILAKWQAAGAVAGVVRSVSDVRELMADAERGRQAGADGGGKYTEDLTAGEVMLLIDCLREVFPREDHLPPARVRVLMAKLGHLEELAYAPEFSEVRAAKLFRRRGDPAEWYQVDGDGEAKQPRPGAASVPALADYLLRP